MKTTTQVQSSSKRNKIIAAAAALLVVVIGYALIVTRGAGFFASLSPETATRTGNVTLVNESDGTKALQFNAPSTTPPTPPAPPTPPTPPPGNKPYVLPGTVGFLGNRSTLKVIPDQGVPAGCSWEREQYLLCRSTVTLENVFVKGGIDAEAGLTLKNSVVEANNTFWGLVNLRGNVCVIQDSTLVFKHNGKLPQPGWGNGGIKVMSNCAGTFERNDVSGTPDGITPTGAGSRIIGNYIHDLASFPGITHNDGFQFYPCSNCLVQGNYIDIGYNSRDDQNAVFFAQDAGSGMVFDGNYLSGGRYTFRNEAHTNLTVTNNTFNRIPAQDGLTLINNPSSIKVWSGNVDTQGRTVTPRD